MRKLLLLSQSGCLLRGRLLRILLHRLLYCQLLGSCLGLHQLLLLLLLLLEHHHLCSGAHALGCHGLGHEHGLGHLKRMHRRRLTDLRHRDTGWLHGVASRGGWHRLLECTGGAVRHLQRPAQLCDGRQGSRHGHAWWSKHSGREE